MQRNHVDEYLIWRVDWLERRYWKYTKVVRVSALGAFLPLIALIAGVIVYGRADPFSRLRILAYAGVALTATIFLMVHAHSRNRRTDIEEELAVLYSFPPTQPYVPPTASTAPAPTPHHGFEGVEANPVEAAPPR